MGSCLLVQSPIIWLTFTQCWRAKQLATQTQESDPWCRYTSVCITREDLKGDLVEQSHKDSLVWGESWERGCGRCGCARKEGSIITGLLTLRLVHVCVSNYPRNLLQALARAAAESWMAYRIKARVVGKREVEGSRNKTNVGCRKGRDGRGVFWRRQGVSKYVRGGNIDDETKAVCNGCVQGRRQWSFSALSMQHWTHLAKFPLTNNNSPQVPIETRLCKGSDPPSRISGCESGRDWVWL